MNKGPEWMDAQFKESGWASRSEEKRVKVQVASLVAAAYRRGQEAMRERAAKAQCVLCRDEGLSVASRPEPDVFWYHPTTEERGGIGCLAGPIRALEPEEEK